MRTACECGCGKLAKVGRRFLVGHSGGGNQHGNQNARKVPVGTLPLSWRAKYRKSYTKKYREGSGKEIKKSQDRSRLWAVFRLTPEERDKIEAFQREHSIYAALLGKHMGTDHCHRTGLIRGRLDFRVNRAYGMIEKAFPRNTAEVLRALAAYHEQPPAELALSEKKYGLIGQAKYKKKMVYGPPVEKKKKAA